MSSVPSPAPATTNSGPLPDSSRRARSTVPASCAWCLVPFQAVKRGRTTPRYCSRGCAARASNHNPETRARIAATLQKPPVSKQCVMCGASFSIRSAGKVSALRRFCQQSCAARWRMLQPERQEQVRQMQRSASQARKGTTNEAAATRMRENNPMHHPEVRARVSRSLRRLHHHPPVQGGNGRPAPLAQQILAEALGWPMEVVIRTGPPASAGLPTHFKLDVACMEKKQAVEVDGPSHNSPLRREQDARKEAFLHSLGWTVWRFTNRAILTNTAGVVQQILGSTT